MLDIVFSESACGSLKMAQSFGKGRYQGGCIGVILHHDDGSEPTKEEIRIAQEHAEEEQRRKWEQSIPLGGNPRDVYGFPLGLSYGNIQDPLAVSTRLEAFQTLFSFWTPDIQADMQNMLERIPSQLEEVIHRIGAGEDARIWYSSQPDELCGFSWFMDKIRYLAAGHGTVYAIKLPEFFERADSVLRLRDWGEVEPDEFSRCIDLAVPVSDHLRHYWGNVWLRLQGENTNLRASIDGSLMSAPDDLYDHYIQMQIDAQPVCFKEAIVVGNVLGKYHLKISDGYIHHRIDALVKSGKLIAESVPGKDEPGYWRMLRKVL